MITEQTTFQPQDFALRLATLREARRVSACAMSHDLGHNRNYINGIELQKYFPSLTEFFEICSYLNISPSDFFRLKEEDKSQLSGTAPAEISPLVLLCDELTPQQADCLYQMLCQFLR